MILQRKTPVISRRRYRRLLEDPTIKLSDIAKQITRPNIVYRFRRFGTDEDNHWVESSHWRDEIEGICRFSNPDNFNKNDSNDSSIIFESMNVLKYMVTKQGKDLENLPDSYRGFLMQNIDNYKKSLGAKVQIACFTEADDLNIKMWNSKWFGDKGRGICIGYRVTDKEFCPSTIPFLPILYDNQIYDCEEVIKALIDLCDDKNDVTASQKMVCLGAVHTLIKLKKYRDEQEWRIIVPNRDEYKLYFDAGDDKKDFSANIESISIGPHMKNLPNYETYRELILRKGRELGKPVYQIKRDGEGLTKVQIQ